MAVVSVSLDKATATVKVGDTIQLAATIVPADASNKAVTYTSSDAGLATVTNGGLVTAKAAGSVDITVVTDDGNKTAKCAVTITTE